MELQLRELRLNFRELGSQGRSRFDLVGVQRRVDLHVDARVRVVRRDRPHCDVAVVGIGDVADLQRFDGVLQHAKRRERNAQQIVRLLDVIVDRDAALSGRLRHDAARHVEVVDRDGVEDVFERGVRAVELDGIGFDVELASGRPVDVHRLDVGYLLDQWRNLAIDEVCDLRLREARRADGNVQQRRLGLSRLRHDGRVEVGGHVDPRDIHAPLHVYCSQIEIRAHLELHDDDRRAFLGICRQLVEMVDAGHLVFDRLDDHALHVLGRGSRIAGIDRDDREVGVGRTRATPELNERDNAKDNQRAKDRDGNRRTGKRETRQPHDAKSIAA